MIDKNQNHDEPGLAKTIDRDILWRLLRYTKPYWWAVGTGLFLLIINATLEISMTFLIQIGIDDYIGTGDIKGLQHTALVFIGIICLMLLTAYGQLYLTMWLGQKVQHDIRTQVFSHLQKMKPSFFDTNPIGRLITRVMNDVSTLNELFSSSIVTIIGEGLSLVFIVAALLYYNWQLALLTFAVLPILIFTVIWFRSRVRFQFRNIRTRIARQNSFVQEHISGIEQVHLYGLEESSLKTFKGINKQLLSSQLKSVYYSALYVPMIEVIGALSLAILMYAGGIRITEGLLTFGELVAFIHLVERFYQPVQYLSEEVETLQSSLAASERIFQLIDTKPLESIGPMSNANKKQEKGISFNGVWFAYNEEKWVLQDINLKIKPGEKLAIVGATGSGKTSLMSLLLRFYDYQKGAIRINGSSIESIPVDRLRSRMGLILQDFYLFSGTIADNIRMGNSSITDREIENALRKVGFYLSPDRFTNGINTLLGERGATLSTGQKQLLSFARAIAFDPQVLILDEATSSIDTETEQTIQQGVDQLFNHRTAFVIAHRLSTIKKCDRIAVLHQGRLVETGSHEELLQTNGIYYKLHSIQKSKLGN